MSYESYHTVSYESYHSYERATILIVSYYYYTELLLMSYCTDELLTTENLANNYLASVLDDPFSPDRLQPLPVPFTLLTMENVTKQMDEIDISSFCKNVRRSCCQWTVFSSSTNAFQTLGSQP